MSTVSERVKKGQTVTLSGSKAAGSMQQRGASFSTDSSPRTDGHAGAAPEFSSPCREALLCQMASVCATPGLRNPSASQRNSFRHKLLFPAMLQGRAASSTALQHGGAASPGSNKHGQHAAAGALKGNRRFPRFSKCSEYCTPEWEIKIILV